MPTHDGIRQGREALERGAWREAADRLAAADAEAPLELADLERLATASYLIGRDAEAAGAWTRAHQASLERDDVERAARCAFWLAFGLMARGKRAQASGWIGRAKRLLDDAAPDCVEQGYLLLPVAFERAQIAWARGGWAAIRPYSTGGNYLNFQLAEDDATRTAGAYRQNLARLRRIKAAYDPGNLFRVNRNVEPSAV